MEKPYLADWQPPALAEAEAQMERQFEEAARRADPYAVENAKRRNDALEAWTRARRERDQLLELLRDRYSHPREKVREWEARISQLEPQIRAAQDQYQSVPAPIAFDSASLWRSLREEHNRETASLQGQVADLRRADQALQSSVERRRALEQQMEETRRAERALRAQWRAAAATVGFPGKPTADLPARPDKPSGEYRVLRESKSLIGGINCTDGEYAQALGRYSPPPFLDRA